MSHTIKNITSADNTNYNSKAAHQHIAKIVQGPDLSAGEIIGGGRIVCGICNLTLLDGASS